MNAFGTLFRITTFGESHGVGVGVVIDGCPAGVPIDMDFIQAELDRRKPGQSRIVSQRRESDVPELLSGAMNGMTTGTPLTFFVQNEDARSRDYDALEEAFRPSHADYTYFAKYGIRDHRGGGRASARETLARVIGGAVAKLFLRKVSQIEISAWVQEVGGENVEGKPDALFALVDAVRKAGDSVGGVIACRAKGVPAGLGEPIYDKLSATLGAAMLGINAVKGFEIGAGFSAARMRGSEHNDIFLHTLDGIRTETNHSGGIQGGISNGMPIEFRVAFKPTATLMRPQMGILPNGETVELPAKGRHDPCVALRAAPIVEAMTALVLADFWLQWKARA